MTDDAMIEQGQELRELMGDPDEELCDELKAHLVMAEGGYPMIQHPLVYSVPHSPQLDAMMNKALATKKEMLAEYEAEKNWSGWVWAHERAYRLDAFVKISPKITDDKAYWELLGHIWTDSENIWQNEGVWKVALEVDRPQREFLMEDDEREALEAMPATLTIHRGYKVLGRKLGMSWTLEYAQASWFARRLAREHERAYVASATVPKDKVIAHFTGRGEAEIVVDPDDITMTKTRRVSKK